LHDWRGRCDGLLRHSDRRSLDASEDFQRTLNAELGAPCESHRDARTQTVRFRRTVLQPAAQALVTRWGNARRVQTSCVGDRGVAAPSTGADRDQRPFRAGNSGSQRFRLRIEAQ